MPARIHITSRPGLWWQVARLADAGAPIISEWYHEGARLDRYRGKDGCGTSTDAAVLRDLWEGRLANATSCTDLIVLKDDTDRADPSCLIEIGAALANGARVWQVGESQAYLTRYYNKPADFTRIPGWRAVRSIERALTLITEGVALPELPPDVEPTGGAYVSSKYHHAAMWRQRRENGAPIVSRWIDLTSSGGKQHDPEAIGQRHWPLWLQDARAASTLVFYANGADLNHTGCLLEFGAALSNGAQVLQVGDSDTLRALRLGQQRPLLPGVTALRSLDEAFERVRERQMEFRAFADPEPLRAPAMAR